MKMPAAMKSKWIAALRSGKYTQDYGLLRTNKGHCCLGVLQEVVNGDVEKSESGTPAGSPTINWYDTNGIEVSCTSNHMSHKYVCDSDINTLIIMNDGEDYPDEINRYAGDKSFNQIADWIEKNVETY